MTGTFTSYFHAIQLAYRFQFSERFESALDPRSLDLRCLWLCDSRWVFQTGEALGDRRLQIRQAARIHKQQFQAVRLSDPREEDSEMFTSWGAGNELDPERAGHELPAPAPCSPHPRRTALQKLRDYFSLSRINLPRNRSPHLSSCFSSKRYLFRWSASSDSPLLRLHFHTCNLQMFSSIFVRWHTCFLGYLSLSPLASSFLWNSLWTVYMEKMILG